MSRNRGVGGTRVPAFWMHMTIRARNAQCMKVTHIPPVGSSISSSPKCPPPSAALIVTDVVKSQNYVKNVSSCPESGRSPEISKHPNSTEKRHNPYTVTFPPTVQPSPPTPSTPQNATAESKSSYGTPRTCSCWDWP